MIELMLCLFVTSCLFVRLILCHLFIDMLNFFEFVIQMCDRSQITYAA